MKLPPPFRDPFWWLGAALLITVVLMLLFSSASGAELLLRYLERSLSTKGT